MYLLHADGHTEDAQTVIVLQQYSGRDLVSGGIRTESDRQIAPILQLFDR